jgi:hypothetical protein
LTAVLPERRYRTSCPVHEGDTVGPAGTQHSRRLRCEPSGSSTPTWDVCSTCPYGATACHNSNAVLRHSRAGLELLPMIIRPMAKRWGSYTPKGRIILNLDLVRASPALIDYVICHELAHGFHGDHRKEWRDLLRRSCRNGRAGSLDWRCSCVRARTRPEPPANNPDRAGDAVQRGRGPGYRFCGALRTVSKGYNKTMEAKTIHVFASDGAWELKREGDRGKVFPTQREAIAAGMESIRSKTSGQLVIHGRNGQIRQSDTYKMTPIQDPPKRSSAAKKIRSAVGKVALRRILSDTHPSSASTPKK